jgi:uncharacterized membrane-anchored protein YitT (DUF2179 family)
VTVESIRLRLLLIAPVRLVLGLFWLVAARAAGGASAPTWLAFWAGAIVMAFLVLNDPRARFQRAARDPEELPADAAVAPAWLHVFHAALPSTVGVTVFAAVTLSFDQTLTALLGGFLAGLGVAALMRAYSVEGGLYLEPRTGSVFRR